jgi:hypothetical protein
VRLLRLITLLAIPATLPAQPALDFKEDRVPGLLLAPDHVVPEFERAQDRLLSGPFHCSACRKAGRYATDARLPAPPRRLWRRPAEDVLGWIGGELKLDPVVISLPDLHLIVDLGEGDVRDASPPERAWLSTLGDEAKKTLSPHARAHLYAIRLLRIREEWSDLLGLRPGPRFVAAPPAPAAGARPSEVYVLSKKQAYEEFARHFFGTFGARTSWWYDVPTEALVSLIHTEKLNDAQLHGIFAHQLAHHFLIHYRGYYQHLPTWVLEGLGHLFQRRIKGSMPHVCVLGLAAPTEAFPPDWHQGIWTLVNEQKETPLADLALLDTRNYILSTQQHLQAWSLTCFMVSAGPEPYRRFVDALKDRTKDDSLALAHLQGLERGFGVATPALHRAWRQWVLAMKRPRR